MLVIHGKNVSGVVGKSGYGAGRNLEIQIPLIAHEFPEVEDCHPGTLNLELESPLLVLAPDHRTRPIVWQPGGAGEVIDFLRIRITPSGVDRQFDAWLYIPHESPHRQDPRELEVISIKPIPPALDGRYEILIERNAVYLPYPGWSAAVVI